MVTHKVKSWTWLFQAIKSGSKLHDIRDMRDRPYKVGDFLILQEFDQTKGEYTGNEIKALITYITGRSTPCAFSSAVLDPNFCILSLKVIDHGKQGIEIKNNAHRIDPGSFLVGKPIPSYPHNDELSEFHGAKVFPPNHYGNIQEELSPKSISDRLQKEAIAKDDIEPNYGQ